MIALPMLRPLRILRIIMLMRMLNRRMADTCAAGSSSTARSPPCCSIFCASLAVLQAERGHPRRQHRDLRRRDLVVDRHDLHRRLRRPLPGDVEGRLVGIRLMVGGVALIGVVTASFAAWLIERVRDRRRRVDQAGRPATRPARRCTPSSTGVERELAELKRPAAAASRSLRASSARPARRRRRPPRPGRPAPTARRPRGPSPRRTGVAARVGVHEPLAAHQRGGGRDQQHDDRRGERDQQAVPERRGDQVREEVRPVDRRRVGARRPGSARAP